MARRLEPPNGSQVGIVGADVAFRGRELLEGFGERPLGLAELPVQPEIARRRRLGKHQLRGCAIGLDGAPLGLEAGSLPDSVRELRIDPAVPQPQSRQLGHGGIHGGSALPFDSRSKGQLCAQRRGRVLLDREPGHRPVESCTRGRDGLEREANPAIRGMPASVRRGEDRGRQLVAGADGGSSAAPPALPAAGPGAGARRGCPPTRARFASDSVSCSSALPATSLVAPHAGDLLEQGSPLLGPERESLVDHALADEQEGVLGEVRRRRAGRRGPGAGHAGG